MDPFNKDNRDYWVNKQGKLFSFDAGYDPTGEFPDFQPATKDDYNRRQREKAYESSSIVNKVGEAVFTAGEEVVRNVVSAASQIPTAFGADYSNPAGPGLSYQLTPQATSAQEIAPGRYTEESIERRDRHPIATVAGQVAAQAPLGAIPGGAGLVARGALGIGARALSAGGMLARNAAFGAATELNEATLENREFDVGSAGFDGMVGLVLDGAILGGSRYFHGASDYFQNASKNAYDRGLQDAVVEPAFSPLKGPKAAPYGPAVEEASVAAANDLESKFDDVILAEQKRHFSKGNVSRNVNSKNFDAQRLQVADQADNLANYAQALEEEAENAVIRNLADELEAQAKKLADKTEGSGPRELEIHQDGGPLVDQAAAREQKIREFRARQAAKNGKAPPPVEDIGEPRIPEEQRQFGVGERDPVPGDWDVNIPKDEYQLPHDVVRDPNTGLPIRDEEFIPRGANGPHGTEGPDVDLIQGPEGAELPPERGKGLAGTHRGNESPAVERLQKTARENFESAREGTVEGARVPTGDYLTKADPTIHDYVDALRKLASSSGEKKLELARKLIPDYISGSARAGDEIMTRIGELEGLLRSEAGSGKGVFYKASKALKKASDKMLKAKNSAQAYIAARDAELIASKLENHPYFTESASRNLTPDQISVPLYELVQNEALWGRIAKVAKEQDWIHQNFKGDARLLDDLSMAEVLEDPDFAKFGKADTKLGRDIALQEMKAKRAMASKDPKVRAIGMRLQEKLDGIAALKIYNLFPNAGPPAVAGMRKLAPDFIDAVSSGTGFATNARAGADLKDLLEKGARKLSPSLVPLKEAGADNLATAARRSAEDAYKAGRVAGSVAGAALGAGLGGGIGGWFGGLVGTKLGGSLVYAVDRFITDESKIAIGQRVIQASENVASVGRRVQSAVSALTNPQWTRNPLTISAVHGGLEYFMGDYGDMQSAYLARKNQLARLEQDPMQLVDEMTRQFAGLEEVNPKIHAQLVQKTYQALSFVRTKIPATIGTSITRKDGIPPSYAQMRTFALYYSGATDPSSVIEDLRFGRGTREQMEALSTVWPEVYDNLKMEVLTQIGESPQPPTLAQINRLNILFGFGRALDATMSPKLAMTADVARRAQREQKGSPGSAPSKTGATGISAPAQLSQLENSQSVYG